MQKTVICYNENEVIEGRGSREDIRQGYNLWIDLINPTPLEFSNLEKTFNLDRSAIDKIEQETKKPQVMIFKNHKFTIFLSLKFNTINNLEKNPIYFLTGDGWLITIHSGEVDLLTKGRILFSQGKKIVESSIDALYYSFLSSMVESYEQILTALEIKVVEVEETAQHRPSKYVLEYLDLLSRQIIVLRRHFWQARHIINYHNYLEEDKDDIKYLKIVYDDINQLIEMVQSYQDTINSTRETFSNSISLQTNAVMKVLTIFSTIVLPLSLLMSVFSIQGFDLNNLTVIPKYFYILMVIMVIITGLSLFIFWKKGWIFSRDTKTSATSTIEKRKDRTIKS
jgi:magnesium transporter